MSLLCLVFSIAALFVGRYYIKKNCDSIKSAIPIKISSAEFAFDEEYNKSTPVPIAIRVIKWAHFVLLIVVYFTHHAPTFSLTLPEIFNSKTSAMQQFRAKHSEVDIFTKFTAAQSESEM